MSKMMNKQDVEKFFDAIEKANENQLKSMIQILKNKVYQKKMKTVELSWSNE